MPTPDNNKAIFVGGYPRVIGVNVPRDEITTPTWHAEAALAQTVIDIIATTPPPVSSDLRAGQITHASTPPTE